jgi:ribA/ribD-fused uncharacterized protein
VKAFTGRLAFCSNFYRSPIPAIPSGPVLPTVEHAYVYNKTLVESERTDIVNLTIGGAGPGVIKRHGRRVTLREDWDTIRLDVMHRLLVAKFTRHPELADRLLATGTEELVEHNDWGDRYWGVSRGSGYNHLGRLLMLVREQLRAAGG